MAGILPTTIRQEPPEAPALPDGETIILDPSQLGASPDKPEIIVEFQDGSVTVNLNPAGIIPQPLKDAKFDSNLAEFLGDSYLGTLADELLRGIEEDERSREEWLQERADGIRLLALKIEKPSSGTQGASAGVDNTSRSRNTMLLEACLRFQATASSELLPTGGPVKVEDKLSRDTMEGDDLAQLLEDDFNYYLTRTASEYVPDTERMLLWTAAGGSGFKKVYRCPIRRRPVSESVDAANLCVSNAATDLANADRVTFKSTMRQSVMKRMQYLKVYRKVDLGLPSVELQNSVDEQKQEITGVTISNRPEDIPYTILECYCQIEVQDDEHKEDGEQTGLPRPYKVTIEKTSRTILEIRRNWHKDDDMERPKEVFVKFPFVPGFGFYDIGLIQILGNPVTAATALLRIGIDAGIFGNFPGGLVGKGSDKQNTTDISVPPGGFAPIDVSMAPDGDIRKVVMALPYKEPGPALMALYQNIVESGSKLGGIPDMAVGEGKQDAPVGTTIAMIEQAVKVIDAVHKRLHTAQSKEFELIRDLFKENPEDFWRFNQDRDPRWDADKLTKALTDYNLVPRADPNTSSNTQRILRAQALYQMAKANPELFQVAAILDYVLRTIGISNPDAFTQPATNQKPPPDPKAMAAIQSAQAQQKTADARMMDAQTKAKTAGSDIQTRLLQSQNDVKIQEMESRDVALKHSADLQADARSQAMSQQHESAMHSQDLQADLAKHAGGIASDHALQAKDHANQQGLAAMNMAAPSPDVTQGRKRGGRVAAKNRLKQASDIIPKGFGPPREAPDGNIYTQHLGTGQYHRVDGLA